MIINRAPQGPPGDPFTVALDPGALPWVAPSGEALDADAGALRWNDVAKQLEVGTGLGAPAIVGITGGYAHSYALTINTPAGALAGDWLYVVLGSTCHYTLSPDLALPPAWTLVHAYVCPNSNAHQIVIGKLLVPPGGPAASYEFTPVPGLVTAPYISASITCVRGAAGTETVADAYNNDDPAGVVAPVHLGTFTPTSPKALLLWTWAWNGELEKAGIGAVDSASDALWFGHPPGTGVYGESLYATTVAAGVTADPWVGHWTGTAWVAFWQLAWAGVLVIDGATASVLVTGMVTATNTPTLDQKAALAGTDGTPSASNLYVTNSDARNTNARTPTAHSHDAATELIAGFFSAVDKTKLDGIAAGATALALGTTAGTACAGNDARLSDARTDGDALHKSISGEIVALTEKTIPVTDDVLVIEDSAASNVKKKVKVGNLPHGGGGSGGSQVTAYRGPTNYRIAASAAWTDVPDYLLSITTTAGQNVLITLALDLYHDNPGSDSTYGLRFMVDGIEVVQTWSFLGLQRDCNMSFCAPVSGLAPGAHTVKLQFYGYNTDTLEFCKGVFAAIQM